MIEFTHKGDFKKTESFLYGVKDIFTMQLLDHYGQKGVKVLANATPRDTGKTAESWNYEITRTSTGYAIYWTNSNLNHGVPIALLIQNGHATGTGGYVQGIDYINPAIQPIFKEIADSAWKAVTNL